MQSLSKEEDAFDYQISEETNELDWIILGSAITSKPLFKTFLQNMAPGITTKDYEESLALIELHIRHKGTP